jgi:hypothetical protein
MKAILLAVVLLLGHHAAHHAVHHHPRACSVRDWGNTQEYHGKWYICNPYGKGFAWLRMPPGRQLPS